MAKCRIQSSTFKGENTAVKDFWRILMSVPNSGWLYNTAEPGAVESAIESGEIDQAL
jgi:hypothetical protein